MHSNLTQAVFSCSAPVQRSISGILWTGFKSIIGVASDLEKEIKNVLVVKKDEHSIVSFNEDMFKHLTDCLSNGQVTLLCYIDV